MACFADMNVSRGSVATYARCGGILKYPFNYKRTKELSSDFFLNLSRFDRIMVMSLWPTFWPTLYIVCVRARVVSNTRA